MPGTWRTTSYSAYETGDLMMCKVDGSGNISWLNILPKQQRELVYLGGSYGSTGGFTIGSYYFGSYSMPYYSGFGALQNKDNINIIFNDNPKNGNVLKLGQRVKQINYFGRSDCFALILDGVTGKYTRKVLFNNKEIPTAMPRLGINIGGEMYMIGKEDRMFGKTKIAVAKVTAGN